MRELHRPGILWPPFKYFQSTEEAADQTFNIILDLTSALDSK